MYSSIFDIDTDLAKAKLFPCFSSYYFLQLTCIFVLPTFVTYPKNAIHSKVMTKTEKILSQKAVRITPMRQLLLEHFLMHQKTLDLAELEETFPKADRTTIYRTLKTFEEKGILHAISHGAAAVKYALCQEYCSSEKHLDQHPHFHCQHCGEMTCLDQLLIPSVSIPEAYRIAEVNMIIKGTCPKCRP